LFLSLKKFDFKNETINLFFKFRVLRLKYTDLFVVEALNLVGFFHILSTLLLEGDYLHFLKTILSLFLLELCCESVVFLCKDLFLIFHDQKICFCLLYSLIDDFLLSKTDILGLLFLMTLSPHL
jgi:hypothetical protein